MGRVSAALILSAVGPEPRTVREVASELHASVEGTRRTLARAAAEGRLYVVAGGSAGRDAFYSSVPDAPVSGVRLGQPRRSSAGAARTFVVGRSPTLNASLVERLRAETGEIGHVPRPRTRGDCAAARGVDSDGEPLPCPWVSCSHHLGINVTPAGSLEVLAPTVEGDPLDLDLSAMEATCSLDVAEETHAEGVTPSFDAVGALLFVTGQRARQIEVAALGALEGKRALRDFSEGQPTKRRLPIVRDEDDDEDDGPEQTSLFGYLG